MGFIGDFVTDMFGGGDSAGDASIAAANTQADYQREALDYLKEVEALPRDLREQSLLRLAGVAGLEGGTGSQQDIIDRARNSPIYNAIMGSRDAGEEAILRNAGATGGLRSGNASYNLADFNVNLENQALLESYNQEMSGLSGLAGLPSIAPQIAQQTTGIGSTLAQGQVAAAQARQQGNQNSFGNLMGLGDLGLTIWGMF